MAQFKETYGYVVVGEKTGNIIKYFDYSDLEENISSSLNDQVKKQLSKDKFTNCVIFNSSFNSFDEFTYYFLDLMIKKDLTELLPKDENITVKFVHKTKKTSDKRGELTKGSILDNLSDGGHFYTLPIIFHHELQLFLSDETDYQFYNDLRNPLFGLIKCAYKLEKDTSNLGMLSKEEAISKNVGSLYNLYNDLNLLRKSASYTESKGLIDTIYRNLLKNKISGLDYPELDAMFDNLDNKVNRNYKGKATEEQINIVSNIRKHFIELYKSNMIDFNRLYWSYYDNRRVIAKNLFNYIDVLVKNGPYYYDSFDRNIYKSLNEIDKIRYIYEFFTKLRGKGELSNINISGHTLYEYNHKLLLKLLDTLYEYSTEQSVQEVDKDFQRKK